MHNINTSYISNRFQITVTMLSALFGQRPLLLGVVLSIQIIVDFLLHFTNFHSILFNDLWFVFYPLPEYYLLVFSPSNLKCGVYLYFLEHVCHFVCICGLFDFFAELVEIFTLIISAVLLSYKANDLRFFRVLVRDPAFICLPFIISLVYFFMCYSHSCFI